MYMVSFMSQPFYPREKAPGTNYTAISLVAIEAMLSQLQGYDYQFTEFL
jgi:hypothetical protein